MNALKQSSGRRRHPLFVVAGLVMVVLLGAGGALAVSALTGGSSPASASSGTAATLNAALGSSPSATATSPAAKAKRAAALIRLRRLGGMYGQATFRGKDGTSRTLAYERGTVVSADGSQSNGSVVVKAANGTTWTWQYESATTVRKSGQKVSISDLTKGERVLVAGPITSGARDARVVIIAAPKSSTPSPAPSSTGGTSSS
jgi:hypothetical protein